MKECATMTVKELATKYGVSADAVRHYCKLGFLKPSRCEENGYRYFDYHDEERLRFLLAAKKIGFSLKDIITITEIAKNGAPTDPVAQTLLEKRMETLRGEISQRKNLLDEMECAARAWRTSSERQKSRGHICGLIENWDQERNGGLQGPN